MCVWCVCMLSVSCKLCVHASICLCVYTDAHAHSTLHLDSSTACMHTCTYEFKGTDVKRILRTCPADCWELFVQCLCLRFRTHASARVRDLHMRILLRMKTCVSIHIYAHVVWRAGNIVLLFDHDTRHAIDVYSNVGVCLHYQAMCIFLYRCIHVRICCGYICMYIYIYICVYIYIYIDT